MVGKTVVAECQLEGRADRSKDTIRRTRIAARRSRPSARFILSCFMPVIRSYHVS